MRLNIKKICGDKNLTELMRESWAISWPMTLIMFLIFMISFADVYVAGRISKEVQAAYGLASQIYFIFSIIGFALTVGAVAVTSMLFTAENKKEDFNTAVDSSLFLTLVCGALISIAGCFLAGPVIDALQVPEVIKGSAIGLMRIYSIGLLFNYLLVNTNGILRACKMIKKSLVTMAVVCFLNIALNFLLAFHTPLGFLGIAVSTVISAVIGCVLNLFFVKKVMTGVYRFSFSLARRIIDIGWPSGLLQVLWQMAAVVIYLILSKLPQHNVEVLAAFTNGLKVESAIFLPAFAFNMANAVITGNLIGKGKQDDAFRSGIVTAVIGVLAVSILTVMVLFQVKTIAAVLSRNAIVIEESTRYICISLLVEPVMAWGVILGGALNGAGDTAGVMRIISLSLWLVRIPLSYFLGVKLGLGPAAVWWSMNLSIIVQTVFMSRRYFSRKWLVHAEAIIVNGSGD